MAPVSNNQTAALDLDLSSGGPAFPATPSPARMWFVVMLIATCAVGFFLLSRISALLVNFWLLESMGYESVFWTNFRMRAVLFVIGFAAMASAIGLPAIVRQIRHKAMIGMIWLGVLVGLLTGYLLNGAYLEFLGPTSSVPFGQIEPIFGQDAEFYVFILPPILMSLQVALLVAVAFLLSSVLCSLLANEGRRRPVGISPLVYQMARLGTTLTIISAAATGILGAILIWFGRYGLLTMDNFEESTEGTGTGPEYVDVVGFFSTKNSIHFEAVAVFALAAGVCVLLLLARRAVERPAGANTLRMLRPAMLSLVLLVPIGADLAFRSAVAIRDRLVVIPNEPVIQLPFLQHHIDATRKAYNLEGIEERTFIPTENGKPLPDLAKMLDSPTIKNAPLWAGFVTRYGRMVGPQYIERILLSEGDMTVYAPTLEIMQAQESLRPYYSFLDVDTIGLPVNGEVRMFASSVRELPQDIIRPWLTAWGQRSFLFTHGHGLIAVSSAEHTPAGDPVYATGGVPTTAKVESLRVENQGVYYGEGATNVAFSNAVGLLEHDIATEQGRIEVNFPADIRAGIRIDSLLKRLVIGYESGALLNVLFSGLIDEGTRAHVFRRPLERVRELAPFLQLDNDPYAVPAENRVMWVVNALTYSEDYPYSARAPLGDRRDLRTEMQPLQLVNYVADSVKVSIDATSGHVNFYKFADEPMLQTWASIYPELFKPAADMPAGIRQNVQYPPSLMTIQFNLIYPYYHQRDALTFYSGEDLLDDSDEVVGPMRGQSGAITFSQGLYSWMAKPGGALPESSEEVQFVLSFTFTPQDPLNLRAIAMAYQYGVDYGKLAVLKIPKGVFVPGPEQADSIIDQDAYISQQIGFWNRPGVEVIRGSTALVVVENEVLYIEPIFIRSRQNPVPQLHRVVVVLRGQAHMGRTLQEALTFAIKGGRLDAPAVLASDAVATE